MSNFEYLITRPGILKIGTIVFGIVSFVLSSVGYTESPYTEFYSNRSKLGLEKELPGTELELFQLTVTGAFLGLSISYLVLYAFIYELCESRLNRRLDTGYHFTAALLLFCGGAGLFYSAVEIEDYGCTQLEDSFQGISTTFMFQSPHEIFCHHFGEKVISGCFTIVNAVLNCLTGVTVFITKDL